MASLYKQPKSHYWWIKFRDPVSGKIERKSTGFGFDSVNTRRARDLEATRTFNESKIRPSAPSDKWDHWVKSFLELRSPRYLYAWVSLKMFLDEKGIETPRQLNRDHCLEYLEWRRHPNISIGKYRAGHNTARLELKVLTIIMAEAVLKELAPFNPCRDLHLKLEVGKIKPELPPAALDHIAAAIELEQEPRRTFFRNSFLISRYHGCRLTETHLNPLDDVRFFKVGKVQKATITFHTKGAKIHTVNLHPALFPLFIQLRAAGAVETYPMPLSPAKEWFNFLTRCGIKKTYPGACFHSLRVTAATTLARGGVSEKKAMSYLGHASTTVHRSYVRLKPDDLDDCAAALDY